MRKSLTALGALIVMSWMGGTASAQAVSGDATPEELQGFIVDIEDAKALQDTVHMHCVYLARGLILEKRTLDIEPIVQERCALFDLHFPRRVQEGKGIMSSNGDEYPQYLPDGRMTPVQ